MLYSDTYNIATVGVKGLRVGDCQLNSSCVLSIHNRSILTTAATTVSSQACRRHQLISSLNAAAAGNLYYINLYQLINIRLNDNTSINSF